MKKRGDKIQENKTIAATEFFQNKINDDSIHTFYAYYITKLD